MGKLFREEYKLLELSAKEWMRENKEVQEGNRN